MGNRLLPSSAAAPVSSNAAFSLSTMAGVTPSEWSTSIVWILSGVSSATVSMSMPPSVEATKETLPGLAVDEDGAVELAVDIGAVFQIEPVDLLARLARLLGDERVAEHFLDMGAHLVGGTGEAHATGGIRPQFLELALAAPTGVDLRFHHIKRPGQRLDGGVHIGRIHDRHAFGHRCAKALEDLLGLIFVDVHVCGLSIVVILGHRPEDLV